jgi:hypothetical protein
MSGQKIQLKCSICKRKHNELAEYYHDVHQHFNLIPNISLQCGYPRRNQYFFSKYHQLFHHMKHSHCVGSKLRNDSRDNSETFIKCIEWDLVFSVVDIERFKTHYVNHSTKGSVDECLFRDCDYSSCTNSNSKIATTNYWKLTGQLFVMQTCHNA